MAIANGKCSDPAAEVLASSPDQKLEQIMTLLCDPAGITAAMLKIKIRAIYEDVEVPAEMQAFIALARRAGLSRERRYGTWAQVHAKALAGDPAAAALFVLPETGPRRGPAATGLYRWYDKADLPLYIGISDRLRVRVKDHDRGSSWMDFAVRSTVERYPTRSAALEAERAAIETEHPIFNEQYNNTPAARQRRAEYLAEQAQVA